MKVEAGATIKQYRIVLALRHKGNVVCSILLQIERYSSISEESNKHENHHSDVLNAILLPVSLIS